MDDEGKCISCSDKNPIKLGGCDEEKSAQKCPNRFLNECKTFSLPQKERCQDGEFLADDGKCYACDSPEMLQGCNISEKCPNRVFLACGYTLDKCPDGETQIENSCHCHTGYTYTKQGRCVNEKGDCYVESFDGDTFLCHTDWGCETGYKKNIYDECVNEQGDCYTLAASWKWRRKKEKADCTFHKKN